MDKPRDATSPILGNKISKALRTLDFAPSRQNWYVQTSGCDLRDILVCAMYCLIPEISLVLYVHDEPRYLVPDHLISKAVDALQQSHKASVDWMASEFGLRGLPDSFLYFDAIEVDTVWRKDANYACLTPTLQVPIPAGLTYKSKALSAGVTKG
jgi:DNA polymerase gamma 1